MDHGLSSGTRLAMIALLLSLSGCSAAPPVQDMSDARQVIAAASDANAREFSPRLLAEAERLVASARAQIGRESYGPARVNAVRAKNRALRALRDAQSASEESQ